MYQSVFLFDYVRSHRRDVLCVISDVMAGSSRFSACNLDKLGLNVCHTSCIGCGHSLVENFCNLINWLNLISSPTAILLLCVAGHWSITGDMYR